MYIIKVVYLLNNFVITRVCVTTFIEWIQHDSKLNLYLDLTMSSNVKNGKKFKTVITNSPCSANINSFIVCSKNKSG